MQLYCDRCNESVDHPIPITEDPELAEIAKDLGYRAVCGGCYDDLLVEASETREHQADDRRSEHRVAARLALTITPSDGSMVDATTEDISDNGARIRSPIRFETGSVVRMSAADGTAEAVAIVEVVWNDGASLVAGLRLVEVSESWQQLVREQERAGD
jgi:hypothetical protein